MPANRLFTGSFSAGGEGEGYFSKTVFYIWILWDGDFATIYDIETTGGLGDFAALKVVAGW
jgi:hypothetical protein